MNGHSAGGATVAPLAHAPAQPLVPLGGTSLPDGWVSPHLEHTWGGLQVSG